MLAYFVGKYSFDAPWSYRHRRRCIIGSQSRAQAVHAAELVFCEM